MKTCFCLHVPKCFKIYLIILSKFDWNQIFTNLSGFMLGINYTRTMHILEMSIHHLKKLTFDLSETVILAVGILS